MTFIADLIDIVDDRSFLVVAFGFTAVAAPIIAVIAGLLAA